MGDAADLADSTILYKDTDTESVMAAGPTPPPRKVDGRSREARAARAASGSPYKAPVPRKGPGGRPARAKTDYRAGIEGIGQMAAFGLSFKSPADAAAVMIHTPPIAQAMADLANEKPEVAAILDRLLAAGPYAALLTAVTPLILQVLCNHGKMPAGLMGTVPPEQLVAMLGGGAE